MLLGESQAFPGLSHKDLSSFGGFVCIVQLLISLPHLLPDLEEKLADLRLFLGKRMLCLG